MSRHVTRGKPTSPKRDTHRLPAHLELANFLRNPPTPNVSQIARLAGIEHGDLDRMANRIGALAGAAHGPGTRKETQALVESIDLLGKLDPSHRSFLRADVEAAATARDVPRLVRLWIGFAEHIGAANAYRSQVVKEQVEGQARAKIPFDKLLEAWNQPAMQALSKTDRAEQLERQGFGHAEATLRRMRRHQERIEK